MDTYYYYKYKKYYNKYLNIKKNINLLGGSMIHQTNDIQEIKEFLELQHIPNNISKLTYKIDDKDFYLINIKLNDDDNKPILFLLAGMSHKSFLGTSNIILSKLDELKNKFKEIYLLEYASFKPDQINACNIRDDILNNILNQTPNFTSSESSTSSLNLLSSYMAVPSS